jgi:amphi-Trp domain-containing protein
VSNKIFKYDGLQEPAVIADYLEAVRDGFARGAVTLTQGEQVLELLPKGLVSVTIEGKQKGEDRKLKMTFRWKERECALPDAPLRIAPGDGDDA